MKRLLLLGILCASAASVCGCGELVAPGGGAHWEMTRPDGTHILIKGNKDTSLGRATLDPATGAFQVVDYSGNGSTLGNVQANAVAQINQTWATSLLTVAGLVRGGAVALPGVSPGPPAASEGLALAREAALARIAACPFMGSDEKARLANLVPLAPESLLTQIVASLPTQPAAAPVVVLSQPESQPE